MKLVGLTGGIASGKSTVSHQLQEREGFPIVDCDLIAFEVVRKGTWGYHRVLKAFLAADIVDANGEIDRAALGELIFNDPSARRRLNQATHLPILLEILKQISLHWLHCCPIIIIDMPLLFETRFNRVTRTSVLVACSSEVQEQRIQHRDGFDRQAAEARIAAQMPLERKRQLADVVLENDGSLEELQQQVDELAKKLKHGSGLHRFILSPIGVLILGSSLLLFR